MIKHWNGTWRSSVYDTLTGGWVEYHPDPSWADPTRRKSKVEMAKIIAEEDQMANRI